MIFYLDQNKKQTTTIKQIINKTKTIAEPVVPELQHIRQN